MAYCGQPSYGPVVEWRQASGGSVPPNAIQVGQDGGNVIYVARAYHEGDNIPGKLVPAHGCCYVAWGGNEHAHRQYEVLTAPYGVNYEWRFASGSNLPPGAIQGGNTADGEPLYIGRVNHYGTMASGKVQPSHGVLYVPYAGKEQPHASYEVLVAKATSAHRPAVVEWRQSSGGSVPPNAIQVGQDGGNVIYVARANHEGDNIPGKLFPAHGCCYVAWGGDEHAHRQYEVLTAPYGVNYEWRFASGSNIPPGAIQGGNTVDGEPLYIGRVNHYGAMTSGKVHPSHGVLYASYAGKEHPHSSYEILVARSANY